MRGSHNIKSRTLSEHLRPIVCGFQQQKNDKIKYFNTINFCSLNIEGVLICIGLLCMSVCVCVYIALSSVFDSSFILEEKL